MSSNQIPTTSSLSGLSPAQLNQQLRAENDSLRQENLRLLQENQTRGAEAHRLHNIVYMFGICIIEKKTNVNVLIHHPH